LIIKPKKTRFLNYKQPAPFLSIYQELSLSKNERLKLLDDSKPWWKVWQNKNIFKFLIFSTGDE
jgi:hypothetical protein